MATALQLFFDSGTQSAVRALWAELGARGLPTLATATHRKHHPHVSLMVAESIRPEQAQATAPILTAQNDLHLTLGSVAVFPGRTGVLYLAVVPTLRLLQLHRAVHATLAGRGVESGRHYLPDVWVPHCTLAEGLRGEQVMKAIASLERRRPMEAEVTSAGVVDTDSGEVTLITELPHSQVAD